MCPCVCVCLPLPVWLPPQLLFFVIVVEEFPDVCSLVIPQQSLYVITVSFRVRSEMLPQSVIYNHTWNCCPRASLLNESSCVWETEGNTSPTQTRAVNFTLSVAETDTEWVEVKSHYSGSRLRKQLSGFNW